MHVNINISFTHFKCFQKPSQLTALSACSSETKPEPTCFYNLQTSTLSHHQLIALISKEKTKLEKKKLTIQLRSDLFLSVKVPPEQSHKLKATVSEFN